MDRPFNFPPTRHAISISANKIINLTSVGKVFWHYTSNLSPLPLRKSIWRQIIRFDFSQSASNRVPLCFTFTRFPTGKSIYRFRDKEKWIKNGHLRDFISPAKYKIAFSCNCKLKLQAKCLPLSSRSTTRSTTKASNCMTERPRKTSGKLCPRKYTQWKNFHHSQFSGIKHLWENIKGKA